MRNNVLMKTIAKIGLLTLAVGVAMSGIPAAIADQPVDYWSVRGLTRPGAWFERYNAEKPASIGVSKSGLGVGAQKSTASKTGKDRTQQLR
jgi:hypothetical protein